MIIGNIDSDADKLIDLAVNAEFNAVSFNVGADTERVNNIFTKCDDLGIVAIPKITSKDELALIYSYDTEYIKIPSRVIKDYDLLHDIDDYQSPIIMSVGMSNEMEIRNAVYMVENNLAIIMYTKNVHPLPVDQVHLTGIYKLQHLFPDVEIGYSSHDIGFLPSIMARMLGVSVFEKHLTLDEDAFPYALCEDTAETFGDTLATVDEIMGLTFDINALDEER